MHSGKKFGRRVAVGALVLGVVLSTAQVGAAAPQSPAGVKPAERSVTLVTGDRVVVVDGARGARAVVPGKGRDSMAFATHQRNGHLFVVPRDAQRLIAEGRLDERLFDITALQDFGYDDEKRTTLPLIVSYAQGVSRAQVTLTGATATADLASVNATAVTAEKSGAAWQSLSGNGIRKVWLDGKRKSSLDKSVPQIGAPAAWQAGYTGEGVKVAVLDTGVDQTHPDLATREVGEKNFSDSADSVDRFGHGTHVASTIAGTGAKAAGKYKGVAYGARILDGKVLSDEGFGYDSWIIAGMQWAVTEGAKVVNLSLGGGDGPEIDPLEEAVNTLSAKHGTLFVIAAGNSGPGDETVGSPGSADAALTVGAVDREDNLAPFSSRGPRIGDAAIKPDITAPGVGIAAAKAKEGIMGTPVEDGYVAASGTSMATPHVAGAAALIAQVHPAWRGDQIKAALTASAKPNAKLTVFQQGAGRVDVARAITQSVISSPTNVGLGTQVWPHDDDQPVSKSVGYVNTGKADVTLDLTVRATGPDGTTSPNGLLTVSPAKITVPAGGEAKATVTADTRLGSLDGVYSGTVVATDGTAAVRTPLAVNREPESYNVTINHIGRDGAPAGSYRTSLYGLDTRKSSSAYDPDGSATIRLPKGKYLLDSTLITGNKVDWLSYPALEVTDDVAIDFDFRRAKPIAITPPDKATLQLGEVSYDRKSGAMSFGYGWVFLGGDLGDLSTAHVGPELPPQEFTTQINTQWSAEKDYFGLAWYTSGTLPTGFTRAVSKGELAHVHGTFAANVPGRSALRFAFPYPKFGQGAGAWAALLPVSLPGDRHEYYTADAAWSPGLWQLTPDGRTIEAQLTGPVKSYQAGRTYEESYNRAVFGPVLPQTRFPFEWVTRTGNAITVNTPLFGDAGGNSGDSIVDKANTVLYRNGSKVGETTYAGYGRFDVPAEAADYRVTTEATRGAPWDVSTSISAAWTFRSGPVSGTGPARLPVSAVRYTPVLDATNSAPAGEAFIVPITYQPQASGTGVLPKTLTVEASYDGGQTWQPATVVANVFAVLHHPNDATSVSLRAKAADRAGNTVEQTIVNAYKLN